MAQESILSRYTVQHEIGRGAAGAVYAARDRATGAVVALKRLDPAALKAAGPDTLERFLKRSRSARRLQHPNIVRIHDAGEAGGAAYVATELVEGASLRELLAAPLPLARAIRIAREIASGLAHAHLQGVVHGGIKPSNVIVPRSGPAKIADFAVGAIALPAPPAETAAAPYLSPEQLQGDPIDHRSDVFSLGTVLYEMLARRPAFRGAAKEGRPPPPSELNPHVPRALDRTILGMISAEPAARMPGVPILLRELERIEEELGLAAGKADIAPEKPAQAAPPPPPEPARPTPPPPPEPAPRPRAPEPSRSWDRVPIPDLPRPPRRAEPRFDPDDILLDYRKAIALMDREARRPRQPRTSPVMYAVLALLLVVLGFQLAEVAGTTALRNLLWERIASAPDAAVPKEMEPANLPEPAKLPAEVAEAPAIPPAPPPPLPAEPRPVAQADVAAKPAPQEESAPAPQPAAKEVVAAEKRGTAKLIVSVSPRGELYVDGKHLGTTPPLTTFDLEPGMYRVEVRNGSRKPYLTYMTLQAGDVRRIRHDFDAKPFRPPR